MGSPTVRRHRRLRIALVTFAVVLLLLSGGLLGFGWYYSGELLDPENARPGYRDTVTSSASGTVSLAESRVTVLPGTWGLVWPDGGAKVGPVTHRSEGTVVRELQGTAPADGTMVAPAADPAADPAAVSAEQLLDPHREVLLAAQALRHPARLFEQVPRLGGVAPMVVIAKNRIDAVAEFGSGRQRHVGGVGKYRRKDETALHGAAMPQRAAEQAAQQQQQTPRRPATRNCPPTGTTTTR